MPRPTGKAARRRFCTETCRKAAWRQRERDRIIVTDVVPDNVVVPTASRDEVPNRDGQHRCPHCRQPLAIISVVIPADAAVIKPPEVLPMTPR